MVGHTVFREIIGADALRAVARADLTFAVGRDGGALLFYLGLIQAASQHGQRLFLVFVLAALVLTLDNGIGRDVRDADSGRGLVDVLAAGAGRAERVDAQILRIDIEVKLLRFGQHGHRCGRGMHAALTLGLRHALDAVYAALELEPRIHAVACDAEHDLFIAAQLGLGTAHHLGLPAAPVRVHRVHAVQIGRKQRAFLAACAAANFDIDVLLVVRVLGQKQELELSLKPRDVALGLLELLLRKLLHIRVGQHFSRVSELLLRPLVCAICFDDRLKLVPFTQQPRRAGRIIIQIRRGQAHFQLVEPRGQHFQFLKHNLSPNRAIHQRPVSISPIMEQYSRQRTAAH